MSRAPHGARGLKFFVSLIGLSLLSSRPARGAWIEILILGSLPAPFQVAPRTGRVD